MICPNCGRENSPSDFSCSECGTPLQDSNQNNTSNQIPAEESTSNKSEEKASFLDYAKVIILDIIGVIIFICIFFPDFGADIVAMIENHNKNNTELTSSYQENFSVEDYTDNGGNLLPILVTQASIKKDHLWDMMDITLEVINTTPDEFRDATIAIMAWDSNELPIRLSKYYSVNPSYIEYLTLENLSAEETRIFSSTFELADISYMAAFLVYCENFDGIKWNNPVLDYLKQNQGGKLNEIPLCYFLF